MAPDRLLRMVLVLVGSAITALGLNIALGGIETLGWQGASEFFTVTNREVFDVQDNHIRFIGAVWLGVGLLFVTGSFAFSALRTTLVLMCTIIAIAGLFRFSAGELQTILSGAIAPSLLLELFGFPLLALWIARSPSVPLRLRQIEQA